MILVPIEDEGKPLKTSRKVSVDSRANRRVQMCDSRSFGNEPQSTKVEEAKALKSSQVPTNDLGKNISNGYVAITRCKFVIVGLLVMSHRAWRDCIRIIVLENKRYSLLEKRVNLQTLLDRLLARISFQMGDGRTSVIELAKRTMTRI